MAIDKEQFIKECGFARLVLKNVIASNDNPEMVLHAKKILADQNLFEKFVLNRIARKAAKHQEQKPKAMAFGRFMSWNPFKR